MTHLQYLLLKLIEETSEVSTALNNLMSFIAIPTSFQSCSDSDLKSKFYREIDDLKAVITVLNSQYGFKFDFDIYSDFCADINKSNLHFLKQKFDQACNEVIKISAKSMQFGLYSKHPNLDESNLVISHTALRDVFTYIQIFNTNFELEHLTDNLHIQNKIIKMEQYMLISVQLGYVSLE